MKAPSKARCYLLHFTQPRSASSRSRAAHQGVAETERVWGWGGRGGEGGPLLRGERERGGVGERERERSDGYIALSAWEREQVNFGTIYFGPYNGVVKWRCMMESSAPSLVREENPEAASALAAL